MRLARPGGGRAENLKGELLNTAFRNLYYRDLALVFLVGIRAVHVVLSELIII